VTAAATLVRSPAADRQLCAAHLLLAADKELQRWPEPGAGKSLAPIASVLPEADLTVLVGRRSCREKGTHPTGFTSLAASDVFRIRLCQIDDQSTAMLNGSEPPLLPSTLPFSSCN
jgi:hypothetical protein